MLDTFMALTVAAALVAAAGVFAATRWGFTEFLIPAGMSLATLYLWGLLLAYWRVRTSRYVITAERVYRSHGRLRFQMTQTTYDKVTDLEVRQSLFGRWLGFGSIRVQTAGTGLQIEGVGDPYRMKQSLEKARTQFLERLLSEYRLKGQDMGGRAAETAEATRGTTRAVRSQRRGDDTIMWRGRPVLVSMLGSLLPAIAFTIFAVVFIAGGAVSNLGALSYGGLVFLLFPALIVFNVWVQYKFTRYEVAKWGVVVTSGWLTRKRVETTYAKVTDVTTYQGIIGRLFDFGSITINTAGSNEAPVVFFGLEHPDKVKAFIDDVREGREPAGDGVTP